MTLIDAYPLLIAERIRWVNACRGNTRQQEAILREMEIFESLLNELLGAA